MIDSPTDFGTLMSRFRAGSPGAAEEMCERFGHHLLRTVRRQLPEGLRRQFDSVDFTQAVWTSLLAASQAPEVSDATGFQAYLNRMAVYKILDLFRRHLTQKHNRGASGGLDDETDAADRAPADVATPSQEAMGNEAWGQLVRDLSPLHRRIIARLREGYSQVEIAAELGINPKSIQRLLERLNHRRGA